MMPSCAEQLLIFARLPQAGANKTRLIPALGAEQATRVYRYLVDQTLREARRLASQRPCHVVVCFTGGTIDDVRAEWGSDLEYREQVGADLGARLQHATKSAFDAGATRLVVIGTDCPSLTADDLSTAYEQLENHDVVLGPANDGGYYLIGVRTEQPFLFAGIDWSTAKVFEQTLQKAVEGKLTVHAMRGLSDVDYPEDLLPLRRDGASRWFPFTTEAGKLSIIIPTLNEAPNLPATLDSIGELGDDLEVIVVDAGSTDATIAIAQQRGCRVFVGNPGRGKQMNAGAAIATGQSLLFLHADTRLPVGYRIEIERVLATPVSVGAFPLAIDAPGFVLRVIESGAAFRSRLLQMPYGDQGLFFRAADFYAQGGFRQMAIMEDYDLVARMRKLAKIGMANKPVQTSARRWLKQGALRTTVVNQICVMAYHLGFSDQTIARLYRGKRA